MMAISGHWAPIGGTCSRRSSTGCRDGGTQDWSLLQWIKLLTRHAFSTCQRKSSAAGVYGRAAVLQRTTGDEEPFTGLPALPAGGLLSHPLGSTHEKERLAARRGRRRPQALRDRTVVHGASGRAGGLP